MKTSHGHAVAVDPDIKDANLKRLRRIEGQVRGLQKMVEDVIVTLPADEKIRAVNPLGKIPALILDDGSAIYDSPVICEYLDELGGGHFFPRASLFKAAEGRWRALTLQALGDGLADAVVRLSALALDLKDVVAELDINPLFVFPQGQGVKAGDAARQLGFSRSKAYRLLEEATSKGLVQQDADGWTSG